MRREKCSGKVKTCGCLACTARRAWEETRTGGAVKFTKALKRLEKDMAADPGRYRD
jgi:hypothetical protein